MVSLAPSLARLRPGWHAAPALKLLAASLFYGALSLILFGVIPAVAAARPDRLLHFEAGLLLLLAFTVMTGATGLYRLVSAYRLRRAGSPLDGIGDYRLGYLVELAIEGGDVSRDEVRRNLSAGVHRELVENGLSDENDDGRVLAIHVHAPAG